MSDEDFEKTTTHALDGYADTPQDVTSPPRAGAAQGPNGLAVASLVLGVFLFTLVGPILALVFGYRAKKDIATSQGRQTGDGLATAGIVLGWVGIGLTVVLAALSVWLGVSTTSPRTTSVDDVQGRAEDVAPGTTLHSSGSGESNVAFCASASEIQQLTADVAADPQAAQSGETFERYAQATTKLAENAPDDIKDAADKTAEQMNQISQFFASVDSNIQDLTPEQQQEFAQQQEQFANEEYTQASEQLLIYIEENCDIDLSDGG